MKLKHNDGIFYPWSYILTKIQPFVAMYGEIMEEEEWNIISTDYRDDDTYLHKIFIVIDMKTHPIHHNSHRDTKAYAIAREYGWLVDENGLVIDYKPELQTRNLHLITGKELGLL
jgi:hypothetical protein